MKFIHSLFQYPQQKKIADQQWFPQHKETPRYAKKKVKPVSKD